MIRRHGSADHAIHQAVHPLAHSILVSARRALVLATLFIAALAIRLWALGSRGYGADIDGLQLWAEGMARYGPLDFYARTGLATGANYPALLYPLWALASVVHGDALHTAIKALSIPFDLALGGLLFWVIQRSASFGRGLFGAALYLLDPATVIAGPYWGQVDAVGTFLLVAALVSLASRRAALAGGLATLALLVKPQFGIGGLVIAVVLGAEGLCRGDWRSAARAAGAAVAAYAVVAAPLRLTPGALIEIVHRTADAWPWTSLYALNPWGVVLGYFKPDGPYLVAGLLLLGAGLLLSLVPLIRRRDLAAILAAGGLMALAFYFLPTRVHERYLFPALALLAPFAATRVRLLIPYLVLCLCFTAGLVWVLADQGASTGVQLPREITTTLFAVPAGLNAIAFVLMASAVAIVVLLLRSELYLAPDSVLPKLRSHPQHERIVVESVPPA